MGMQMCARCQKRMAVVFITRTEEGKTVQEGLCFQCAKAMGIPSISDVLNSMGITEEQADQMTGEFANMMNANLPAETEDDAAGEDGGAPAIDFPRIFQNLSQENPQKIQGEGKKASSSKQKSEPKYKYLDGYCQNLTKKAAEGKMDRIVGRHRELERVIQILSRRQKNNPCLIGEPGVGKTAIAEALAQRIVDGKVPFALREKELYLVDLTALVAGTQFRGQFESRILGLLNDVKNAGNAILVIDEVHNIVGAGDSEGSMSAANIMKPALSRGEIQVIGATTLTEYRKFIEKDSALERRFQPVTVNEPSLDDSEEMLRGIKKYYEDFHGIEIPENTVRTAVTLSERYITDRYLPDKAIDLLDEAAARVSMTSGAINELRSVRAKLATLGKAKQEAEAMDPGADQAKQEEKYKRLADIRVEELQLIDRQAELEGECATLRVTAKDLADVIEVWTGIPASTIAADEFERLEHLDERLKEKVIGQDVAVLAVVRAIKRKRAGVSYRRSPVSFIFAGPTGVGKTELVKVLAAELFQQPESLIRLDMSEFMEKHSVSRIIGAPPGYVGYDEAGQLTEKIRRRPYSVILFDEIEKAHPDVLNILLQVLDDGRITDARGKTVNFENTVIIMTTNAGSERASSIAGFAESKDLVAKERTEKALAKFLRPEFINRIDEIITFRALNLDDFKAIASITFGKLRDTLLENGISLSVSEAALELVAKASYSEKYGARNMHRYIEKNVQDPMAEEMIRRYNESIVSVSVDAEGDKITVACH